MRVGFLSLIVLFLVSQSAFAQSTIQPIQNEAQLASALCDFHQTAESREFLLKSNSHLVNENLWRRLIERAAATYYNQSPEGSLVIYDIAIKIAVHLSNPKLIATTYYNLGRTYSGLNEFRKSIDAYEYSRRFFTEAGLQRDLLYVLADLGAFITLSKIIRRLSSYRKRASHSRKLLNHKLLLRAPGQRNMAAQGRYIHWPKLICDMAITLTLSTSSKARWRFINS